MTISLSLSASEEHYERKKEALESISAASGFPSLLAQARVLSAHDSDFYFGFNQPSSSYFGDYVSARNEGAALGLLAREAHAAQDQSLLDEIAAAGNAYAERARSCDNPTSCSYAPGSPATSTVSADSKEGRLLKWGEDQGMNPLAEPAEFPPGMRGLAARRDLRPGESVITIPEKCMIGVDTVVYPSSAGPIYKAIRDKYAMDDDTVLMLWCMYDREDPESDFKEYWAALPPSFHTGLTFSTKELDALKGSPVYGQIIESKRKLRETYDALFPHLSELVPELFPKQRFTWPKLLWMAQLFHSYIFTIKLASTGTNCTCLLPLVDLMNHSPYPHVARYGSVDPATQAMTLPLLRPCARGEQVFLSYGVRPNDRLVNVYGFAIPNNPHDSFSLSVDLEGDRTAKLKETLLGKFGIPKTEQYLKKGLTKLPAKLVGAFRVYAANKQELEKLLRGELNPLVGQLNDDNERQALDLIKSAIKGALGVFPRSVGAVSEDDRKKHPALPFIDVYIRGQREILEEALLLTVNKKY